MKRKTLFALMAMLCISGACFAQEWQEISAGETAIKSVLVDWQCPRTIFMGSAGSILKSEDGGKNWRIALSLGGKKEINLLYGSGVNRNLFAATSAGLYMSQDRGENWKRIFNGRGDVGKECICICAINENIFLGTKAGLFISRNLGRSWEKAGGVTGNSQVFAVSCAKELGTIYVVCNAGVFKSNNEGKDWLRVFVAFGRDNESTLETEEGGDFALRYLSVDQNSQGDVYLASSKGVYASADAGTTWRPLTDFGLLSQDIKRIFVSPGAEIYATTSSAIFEYDNKRWREISFTLVAGDILSIAFDRQGNLYAACQQGLFRRMSQEEGSGYAYQSGAYLKNEPNIKDVQKAAIRYAEVEPEKIARWRKQAALKAFLPNFSTNIGRDTGDLWHWETGSSTKNGDDVLLKGNDALDWSVSMSWDLGQIIWNNDQTSIDVRSKLMAELRGDILDQVTKLYFERIRLKSDLDDLAIEDIRKKREKELRIEELTAQLDALTGGYFSQQL